MSSDVLTGWENWGLSGEPPALLGQLKNGLTNQNFVIEVAGKRYVLRRNAEESTALGIDRQQEKAVLQALAGTNLTPEFVYFSAREQVCVWPFVKGKHWDVVNVQQADKRQQLFSIVERIHQVPCELAPRDYQGYIDHYWHGVMSSGIHLVDEIHREREYLQSVLAEFSNQPAVLVHHDLVASNLLDTGEQLYVLDWEYAARGQAEYDIATLLREWNLSQQDIAELNYDRDKLEIALRLYDHLFQLWYFLKG